MFTGIIEKISQVENISYSSQGAKVSFRAPFYDINTGDSIAVNGACLSVVNIEGDLFEMDIMPETLNHTNLKNLKNGDLINLERALKVNSRLNGHIVLGHIDTTAVVKNISLDGFSKIIGFNSDTDLIILKGSITINGVSLTVSRVEENYFEVSIIPITQNETNLNNLKIGDIVNIEYDVLAKLIKKFTQKKDENITFDFLKENGFM